jgi:hypothetical protein
MNMPAGFAGLAEESHMKPIIVTLASVAIALAVVRRLGPAVAAWARQKCLQMMERRSSACPRTQLGGISGTSVETAFHSAAGSAV